MNLTILQLMCYFVIGYIMGVYLDWIKFGIMFVVILVIQIITRTKAVADGMMYRQLMMDNEWEVNEVIQKIRTATKSIICPVTKGGYLKKLHRKNKDSAQYQKGLKLSKITCSECEFCITKTQVLFIEH